MDACSEARAPYLLCRLHRPRCDNTRSLRTELSVLQVADTYLLRIHTYVRSFGRRGRQGLVRRERCEDSNAQNVYDVSDDRRKRQKRPFLKYGYLISIGYLKYT